MAIFHFTAKIISRNSGRSSVASAAYRAAEKIPCSYDGLVHDYTKKKGVIFDEVLLPENAPSAFLDRCVLWNSVEMAEKSKNAQTAREVEIALPSELNKEENIYLIKKYVTDNFVNKGMCADICVHDKKDGNPHAHIMLTMRPLNQDGTWGPKSKKVYLLDEAGYKIYDNAKKTYKCYKENTTDWDNKNNVSLWRNNWAELCNSTFKEMGINAEIDHRSFEEQGKERIPTVHLGPYASALKKQNKYTELGEINENIITSNHQLDAIDESIAQSKAQIISFSSYKERLIKLKDDIDIGVKSTESFSGFLSFMREKGYGVKQGKYLAFSPPEQGPEHIKFIRVKSIGEQYKEESILLRLANNREAENPLFAVADKVIYSRPEVEVKLLIDVKDNIKYSENQGYKNWVNKDNLQRSVGTLNYLAKTGIWRYEQIDSVIKKQASSQLDLQQSLKQVEGRLKTLSDQLRQTQVYLQTKDVNDAYSRMNSNRAKNEYLKTHGTELKLHESAKNELQQYKVDGKLKRIDTLQAELDGLKLEKESLYTRYNKAKVDVKEMINIKRNVDAILGIQREQFKEQLNL